MKASDLFLQCLETEGIDDIFGVPGEGFHILKKVLWDVRPVMYPEDVLLRTRAFALNFFKR